MFSKKWVLSTFIIFSLLVVFSQLFIQSRFFAEKIREAVETRLEQILQKQVTVGQARLNLLSSTLVIKDLAIQSASPLSAAPFFAKEINITFSPVSLFTETFLIRRITIESPSLSLNEQSLPDFLSGFSNIASPSSASKRLAFAPPRVMIRSIRLSAGSVSYKGNQSLKALSLGNITAEIRPDLTMKQFEIDLKGQGGGYILEGLSGDISQLEAKVSLQPEQIVLKRALLIASQGQVRTQGKIKLTEKEPVDLSIDLSLPLETLPQSFLKNKKAVAFYKKSISGDIHFLGRLRGRYAALSISGTAKLPQLRVDGKTVASARAEVRYQEGAISIPTFSGNIFSGDFAGAAEININSMSSARGDQQGSPLFVVSLKTTDLPLYQSLQLVSNPIEPDLRGIVVSGDLVISDMGIKKQQLKGKGQLSLRRHPASSRISSTTPLSSTARLTSTSRSLEQLSRLLKKGAFHWRFDHKGLHFNQGRLFFPDTEMRFDGLWQETTGLKLNTRLKSTEIRHIAKALHFPLSGRSRVKGVLTGRPAKKDPLLKFKGSIDLENWTISGQPFARLKTDVALQGKQIVFKKGRLQGRARGLKGHQALAPSDILFEGMLDLEHLKSPYFNFQTRLKAGNAQEIFGFFKLNIPLYTLAKGRFKIAGHPKDFSGQGFLSLSKGWLYGEPFDQGSVDLTVTQNKVLLRDTILQRGESRLTGTGKIDYKQHFSLALTGDKLRIEETGFLKRRFPALTGDIDLSVEGEGSFKHPLLRFISQFESLRYQGVEMHKGRIRADWKDRNVHFDAAFPKRHLTVKGSVHLSPDHPFSFQSRFSRLKIDQFLKALLSGPAKDIKLFASGTLAAAGRLTHLADLSFSAALSELSADFGDYQLKNDGPLNLRAKDGMLVFDQTSFAGENTALTLNGRLSLIKRWDLFVKGEADLALLSYFSKTISSGSGKARLDLSITDEWDSPRLRGQLSLKDGKIRVTHFAQSIHIDSLNALFNEQQLILEQMSGRLGGGRFQLTGKATRSGFKFSSFGLFLNLDHTRVMLAEQLPVTLSGELFLQRQEDKQVLKGELQVLRLVYDQQIDLKTLGADLRKGSGDSEASDNDILGKTALNIHFMGDRGLRVENNVAKVPLSIDLLLKGSVGNPLLIGRVDVPKGEVYFLKNTFKVLSASVDFLNPEKIDPTFNMEASTDVRNVVTDRSYKVDLGLSGTVSQVTLRFHSFPDLSEDDILALLAIGKTSADLDQVKGGAGTEASNIAVGEFLSESVNEISGVVGDPLEKLTGTRLKVDPYISGTDSRTTTGTRLTAEKRLLQDQLLVVYSTTLDPNEEDLIKMVYEINKNISLVGNRDDSGQIGGDLRFRFEFR